MSCWVHFFDLTSFLFRSEAHKTHQLCHHFSGCPFCHHVFEQDSSLALIYIQEEKELKKQTMMLRAAHLSPLQEVSGVLFVIADTESRSNCFNPWSSEQQRTDLFSRPKYREQWWEQRGLTAKEKSFHITSVGLNHEKWWYI